VAGLERNGWPDSPEYADLIDNEKDNILETITLTISIAGAHSKDEEKAARIEGLLKKCLVKYQGLGEKEMLGITHYNLGNYYRGRRLNRLAAYHYLNARKHEARYLDEPYYWAELGGVFFELEKFNCSAKIYNVAQEKGAPAYVMPLAADALMFAGKYQSALDLFSEYLDNNKEEHEEWHLKRAMLADLIEGSGVREQIRNKQGALELIDVSKADKKGFGELLESALELDMLCGLAWFNLGIDRSKAGKHEKAAFNFIMCGLVQSWDIEAWINALLCCMNKEVPSEYYLLSLRTAYFFNGEDFLLKFYEELSNRSGSKDSAELINMVEEMLPKKRHKEGKVELRMMGRDGMFRNILKE